MSKKADDAAQGTKRKRKKTSSPASTKPAADPPPSREKDGKYTTANPTAWKPGQSGNPAGRPKCRTLSEAIRAKLQEQALVSSGHIEGCVDKECYGCKPTEETWADLIAERLVRVAAGMSIEQSVPAVKEIGDRTEGKARQPIEIDPTQDAMQLLANLLGKPIETIQNLAEQRKG